MAPQQHTMESLPGAEKIPGKPNQIQGEAKSDQVPLQSKTKAGDAAELYLDKVQIDRKAEQLPDDTAAEQVQGLVDTQEQLATLTYEQVRRLDGVLNEVVPIHGRGNFPTIEVKLKDLVEDVRQRLETDSVPVKSVRINGGAASYILSADDHQAYNDIDLIFLVDLKTQKDYEHVKTAVLHSLLDSLPADVSRKRMSSCSMREAYVHKMVKVSDSDRWSLISLSNHGGRNIELKFVDTMRRKFEFSVDSFQILLDSILLFYRCAEPQIITETFYPTVLGLSVYGDFQEALYHLQKKLIATWKPEEIRGGGLLKYCNLLVKNYTANSPDNIKTLERYMCSRFFIDFPDVVQQRNKLETYLHNHFVGSEEHLKYAYLLILHKVVGDSTVCLMSHERRQTLLLIQQLAYHVYMQQQHQHQQQLLQKQYESQQQSLQQQQQPATAVAVSSAGVTGTTGALLLTPCFSSPVSAAAATTMAVQCTCSWTPCSS